MPRLVDINGLRVRLMIERFTKTHTNCLHTHTPLHVTLDLAGFSTLRWSLTPHKSINIHTHTYLQQYHCALNCSPLLYEYRPHPPKLCQSWASTPHTHWSADISPTLSPHPPNFPCSHYLTAIDPHPLLLPATASESLYGIIFKGIYKHMMMVWMNHRSVGGLRICEEDKTKRERERVSKPDKMWHVCTEEI